MPNIVRQYLLNAPLEPVWALLGTPERWPAFVGHLQQARLHPETVKPGASVDVEANYRGLMHWSGQVGCEIDAEAQVVSIWQRTNPVVEVAGRLRVFSRVKGRTIVRVQAEYRALTPWAGMVIAAKLDRYLDKTARLLEQAALKD